MGKKLTTEDFIEKARKVHGDKYDYSKVVYEGNHKKVIIICSKHGEFLQEAAQHLYGSGCPKCAVENVHKAQMKTTEQFVEECKAVHANDDFDYSKTVYYGSDKDVIITCKKHGDFTVNANTFLHGGTCPKCSKTHNSTTEDFIEKARKVHGDKYDYSKVEYVNSKTKVCIICPEHGEFWQTPSRHLSGDRCPMCFRSFKKTKEQFIEEARRVHGDKYDYSKVVYGGNKKPVIIICPEHGEFLMKPLSHLQGQGCQKCYDDRRGDGTRKTQEKFVEELKEIYKGKNYLFDRVNYVNANTKVCITCPKHGDFYPTPNSITTSHCICPKCASEINGINKRLTTEQFINKAKSVHGNKYDYSKVEYKTGKDYVTIICKKHGDFKQIAEYHLQGNGCPICNESHLESSVRTLLIENNIKFEEQKRFPWLGKKTLDFYLPDFNIAIECQGEQHFEYIEYFGNRDKFRKQVLRDISKNVECEENDVELFYVVNDKNSIKNKNDEMFNGIYRELCNIDDILKILKT